MVRRGEEDQTVILTAKFTFQYTNDVIGEEAPIELVNTFEVTVPAMDLSLIHIFWTERKSRMCPCRDHWRPACMPT